MLPANIDFETRSTIDIKKTGVYPYAMHETTDIWVMAVAYGDEEPEIWSPLTDLFPNSKQVAERLIEHVFDDGEVHAWNANFERIVWKYILAPRYKFIELNPEQVFCTMAKAAAYGLPQALDYAAEVLGTDDQKDREGKQLMMRMAKPRSFAPDGKPVWWYDPQTAYTLARYLDERGKWAAKKTGVPEGWQAVDKVMNLAEYCKQDVRTERAIGKKLQPLIPSERALYLLDQKINDRGVLVDRPLAEAALKVSEIAMEQANTKIAEVTGGRVQAVTQVIELTGWIQDRGIACGSVAKEAVSNMLAGPLPDDVREALTIRQESGKSSVAKAVTMLEYGQVDDRMRGMLSYHGAGTGRWAGRGPQIQNFPRVSVYEPILDLVRAQDVDAIEMLDSPMAMLSSTLRQMLIPSAGHQLYVADFASIEARVLGWLAGQQDLLQLFRNKGKIYETMAAKIYTMPLATIGKDSKERQVGKQAVLGLGFQMGAGKFVETCWKQAKVQITEDFAKEAVKAYRDANSKIVELWKNLNDHVIACVARKPAPDSDIPVKYYRDDEWLYCQLPSGRTLKYAKPRIVPREMPWTDEFDRPVIKDCVQVQVFDDQIRKWIRKYLYGGLLAENITQAVARDLMAEAMVRVEKAGYSILFTVHDEVAAEAPIGHGSVNEFEGLMIELPKWADGCPVAAEAWSGLRYKK